MSWDILKLDIYEKWKKNWFSTHSHEIADLSWNYLFTGGKEIRPKLFCELWNYLAPDLEINVELAFAIECIHVASLVLDDSPWMDNASERRGNTTLHMRLTPKKAVLIFYELLEIVRTIWIENKPIHISSEVWQTLLQSKLELLVIGQWYDLEKKGELLELASLKTGTLFELVTETVALCTGFDTTFWRNWGNNLGVLFQWMDDWKDREQDLLQNNRNAFNESYDWTYYNYSYIWYKLKLGIGSQWFTRPFGKFMRQYFTQSFNLFIISDRSVALIYSVTILYPINISKVVSIIQKLQVSDITFINNQKDEDIPKDILEEPNIIQKLYNLSKNIFTYKPLQTDLWTIDETTWLDQPEIKEWIGRVKSE